MCGCVCVRAGGGGGGIFSGLRPAGACSGAPVWGRADASLLGQVLENFVSNALKFNPRGATVRLALAESRAAGRVRVEVIDAGPGIGEADRAKLFRKYSGSGARPTRRWSGMRRACGAKLAASATAV